MLQILSRNVSKIILKIIITEEIFKKYVISPIDIFMWLIMETAELLSGLQTIQLVVYVSWDVLEQRELLPIN